MRNSAHSLVKMLDPFRGEGVLVTAATHPEFLDLMRDMLLTLDRRGILLREFQQPPALRFGLPGSDAEWLRLAQALDEFDWTRS